MPFKRILKLIGCAAIVSIAISYYAYVSFAIPDPLDSKTYHIKPADEIFLLDKALLSTATHIILVGGGLSEGRHLAVKHRGKNSIDLYTNINSVHFNLFYDSKLKPALVDAPVDFRAMASLNGIGKRLGVDNDPIAIIAKQTAMSAWHSFTKMAGFFVFMVLIVVAMILVQGSVLKNTIDKHDPEDIDDSLDDLVGMNDIKAELLQLAEMINNRELYQEYGVDRPFNCMMTGPAGTGKTKIARCLAKILDIPLYYASAASLETGYVGGGPKTLKSLYKKASKNKRAIIFLDEAEGLLMSRNKPVNARYENETMTTLLSLLDGVNSNKGSGLIWIVASNFDEHKMSMDDAMLRRFHLKINFRLPNQPERLEILNRLINKRSSHRISDDIHLDHLATICTGMSPAALESLVSRASLLAIQEKSPINQDILLKAFERTAVGLTDRATTLKMDQKRRIIAIHESGHFIAQLHHAMKRSGGKLERLPDFLNVLKISTESVSKIGALGFVLSKTEDMPLESRREYEECIVELYGGVANEELFLGEDEVTAGSHNDIERVSHLLSMMFNEVGYYSKAKLNYKILQKSGVDVGQQRYQEINERSETLYAHTLKVLDSYRDLTVCMTDMLMKNYVITLNEIIPIVEEFYKNNPETHKIYVPE